MFLVVHFAAMTLRAQTASKPADVWPMFRGNPQLTGVSPTTLPASLKVHWRFDAAESIQSSPAIVDGIVYFACDNGMLYARSLSDGREIWTFSTPDVCNTPIVTASTQPARLLPRELKPAARQAASQPSSRPVDQFNPIASSPLVTDNAIYFGDDNGLVYALDRDRGTLMWLYRTSGSINGSPNLFRNSDGSETIIVGSQDGVLYGLGPDGTQRWRYETDDQIQGTPAVFEHFALIGGCDTKLHIVDARSGKRVATAPLGSQSGVAAATRDGRVVLGTYGSHVVCLNARDGSPAWDYLPADKQMPFCSSAAVTAELAIIGGRDKLLHALDIRTGAMRWSAQTRGRVDSSPLVVGDSVFVGSLDGRLYRFNLTDGAKLWEFDSGAAISASPSAAQQRLLVANESGVLYCFGP